MNSFESSRIPNRLSQEDITKIMKKIDDDRVSDTEDFEHFIIDWGDKKTFVPKREKISIQRKTGVESVKVEEYIRELLDESEE